MVPTTSCSLPSSQNTAGLVEWKKKRLYSGKKNPVMTPANVVDCEDWDKDAVPPPAIESIHCSSNMRACSSTRSSGQTAALAEKMKYAHSLRRSRSRDPDSHPQSAHGTEDACWRCLALRTLRRLIYRTLAAVSIGRSMHGISILACRKTKCPRHCLRYGKQRCYAYGERTLWTRFRS